MLSTEDFFYLQEEKHKVHGNKVLALARLTYQKNLLIGEEKSAHCLH